MNHADSIADGVAGLFLDAASRAAALDTRYLVAALVLQLLNLGFRSLAWRGVLASAYPDERIRAFPLGCAYVAGVALNGFLPARGGEAAKIGLARAQIGGSAVTTVAGALTLVVALDGVLGTALIGLLWALGVMPTLPSVPVQQLPLVAAAGVAVAALALVGHRMRPRLVRELVTKAARGLAVLRTPRRYLLTVVPFQVAAWVCRIGVVLLVLGAYGIHAGLETAALLVALNGLSTAVPVPGGAGAQQALAAYALQGTVGTAGAVSFSLGMQVGVTVVNTVVGVVGSMLLFRTLRPLAAARARHARP